MKIKLKQMKSIVIVFFGLVTLSSVIAHGGSEYPECARKFLAKKNIVKNFPHGEPIQAKFLSENEIGNSLEIYKKEIEVNRYVEPSEYNVEIIENSEETFFVFDNGHIHEENIIQCRLSLIEKNTSIEFQIKKSDINLIQVTRGFDDDKVLVYPLFDEDASFNCNGKIFYVPCFKLFYTDGNESSYELVLPFRSYQHEENNVGNDFFTNDGGWTWLDENTLIAQNLVTEDKYGSNIIKEKRLYVFSIAEKTIHQVNFKSLEEIDFFKGHEIQYDFFINPKVIGDKKLISCLVESNKLGTQHYFVQIDMMNTPSIVNMSSKDNSIIKPEVNDDFSLTKALVISMPILIFVIFTVFLILKKKGLT